MNSTQVLGVVVLCLPGVLIVAGWIQLVRNRRSFTALQLCLALFSLSAMSLSLLGFCLMPGLGTGGDPDASFSRYRMFGTIGLWLSISSFLTAFGAKGIVRFAAVFAGLGVIGMWCTIGFYPFA